MGSGSSSQPSQPKDAGVASSSSSDAPASNKAKAQKIFVYNQEKLPERPRLLKYLKFFELKEYIKLDHPLSFPILTFLATADPVIEEEIIRCILDLAHDQVDRHQTCRQINTFLASCQFATKSSPQTNSSPLPPRSVPVWESPPLIYQNVKMKDTVKCSFLISIPRGSDWQLKFVDEECFFHSDVLVSCQAPSHIKSGQEYIEITFQFKFLRPVVFNRLLVIELLGNDGFFRFLVLPVSLNCTEKQKIEKVLNVDGIEFSNHQIAKFFARLPTWQDFKDFPRIASTIKPVSSPDTQHLLKLATLSCFDVFPRVIGKIKHNNRFFILVEDSIQTKEILSKTYLQKLTSDKQLLLKISTLKMICNTILSLHSHGIVYNGLSTSSFVELADGQLKLAFPPQDRCIHLEDLKDTNQGLLQDLSDYISKDMDDFVQITHQLLGNSISVVNELLHKRSRACLDVKCQICSMMMEPQLIDLLVAFNDYLTPQIEEYGLLSFVRPKMPVIVSLNNPTACFSLTNRSSFDFARRIACDETSKLRNTLLSHHSFWNHAWQYDDKDNQSINIDKAIQLDIQRELPGCGLVPLKKLILTYTTKFLHTLTSPSLFMAAIKEQNNSFRPSIQIPGRRVTRTAQFRVCIDGELSVNLRNCGSSEKVWSIQNNSSILPFCIFNCVEGSPVDPTKPNAHFKTTGHASGDSTFNLKWNFVFHRYFPKMPKIIRYDIIVTVHDKTSNTLQTSSVVSFTFDLSKSIMELKKTGSSSESWSFDATDMPFKSYNRLSLIDHPDWSDFQIASGGQASIYNVNFLGLPCALKVFTVPKYANESFTREFTGLANSYANPNCIKLIAAVKFSTPKTHSPNESHVKQCILMEQAMEMTVKHHLQYAKANWKRSLVQLQQIRLCLGIARGIYNLHKENVLHRDLKASNILVTDYDMEAKLCDFGMQKVKDTPISNFGHGTSSHRAPELSKIPAKPFSFASDIFAFGLVIWEILSIQDAPERADLAKVPELPNHEFGPALNSLYDHCCDPDPEKRCDIRRVITELTNIDREFRSRSESKHYLDI